MSTTEAPEKNPAETVPPDVALGIALAAVSSAFGSLGRVFLCIDGSFHVLHASSHLDRLSGEGATRKVEGRLLGDLLGTELFGPAGTLRQLMLAGERREGWRAWLTVPGSTPRPVSLAVAPFCAEPGSVCDPRVAYVVALRPAAEEQVASDSPFPGLVGRSAGMQRLFGLIENLEHSDAPVLLVGERGTGKEAVARALHAHSPRRAGPFVTVSCNAPSAELLESELFGHALGAFSGAVRECEGRIETAARGTLFLEEVVELPRSVQAKLLAVVRERTFTRVGDGRARPVEARIVAATRADLRRAVREGRFDEELHGFLRAVSIEVPPLRERREDVEPLATILLARVGARQGRALRFSPDTLRLLLRHAWPGNVRELEAALEYAVAVCSGDTVLPQDLPESIAPRSAPLAVPSSGGARPEPRVEQESDTTRIRAALEACRWRRHEAARALGMSRTTLWRRMRELGLE
jgi:DNA-binding NtrC family response regulator